MARARQKVSQAISISTPTASGGTMSAAFLRLADRAMAPHPVLCSAAPARRRRRADAGIGEPNGDMTMCVTGRGNDRQDVVDRIVPVDENSLPSLDHRQHAVAIGAATLKVRVRRRIAARIADLVLNAREQIFSVRES